MTNKELLILGMALDALLETGQIGKVREIVKVMADKGTKPDENRNHIENLEGEKI